MGDFDRYEKPTQANESKKLVMVVMLGAALLGLVGYQLLKHGPQPASAATTDLPETPGVSETPAVLRQTLANNPTADLLRAGTAEPAVKPIRNPFRMGSAWLATLHQVQVRPAQVDTGPRPQPRPYVEPTQPLAVRVEDFKLNSIVNSGNSMAAIINGKVVRAGDVVGKARIVQITGQEVILQHVDFADGPTTTLSMQPRLNQP